MVGTLLGGGDRGIPVRGRMNLFYRPQMCTTVTPGWQTLKVRVGGLRGAQVQIQIMTRP